MLRAALLALCAVAFASGASARDGVIGPEARAAANLMIEALPPEGTGDHAYVWDAISTRTARFMHWHVAPPDPIDRPPDAITSRSGWMGDDGYTVGVIAEGLDHRVLRLRFSLGDVPTSDVLAALRAEFVAVDARSEDETSAEYWITPPNRDGAQLTAERVCTRPGSAMRRYCETHLTLAFEAP